MTTQKILRSDGSVYPSRTLPWRGETDEWLASSCGAGWESFSETPDIPYSDAKFGIRIIPGSITPVDAVGIQTDIIETANGPLSIITATSWIYKDRKSNRYHP